MSEQYPAYCNLCGMPNSQSRLIRLAWEDESDETTFRMKLIVARNLQDNNSIICEDCIRQIKRLPFSSLDDNPPWDPAGPIPHSPTDGTDDGDITELPF